MRKILITNDDGIKAHGLIRLAEAAIKFGEVWVVAPDGQRSAMSQTVTLRRDIIVKEVDFPVKGVHAYSCDGTPVDCVRIGALNIIPEGPDHVLAGINYGHNIASDLQYSATAGAAFEAAFQKFHAIAFSEDHHDCHEVTDRYLSEILEELLDKPLGLNQIWNVNFPGCELKDCKGVLRDRKVSTAEFYRDRYTGRKISEGVYSYTLTDAPFITEADEGTDTKAVYSNYVSIGVVTNIS